MKLLRYLLKLPIDFVCWLGVPYKKSGYYHNKHHMFEHYLMRFIAILAALGGLFFFVSALIFIPLGVFAVLMILIGFDAIIYGCRAVLVSKIMSESTGGQELTVYNQADLWKDSQSCTDNRSTYERFYR